ICLSTTDTRLGSSSPRCPGYTTPSGWPRSSSRAADMRELLAGYRGLYGSHPLHLLTMVAGFALIGYLVATFKPATLWNAHVWFQSIPVWFAAAIVLHDLVLFATYALADRLLLIPAQRRHRRRGEPVVSALNYVRIPALASAL